MQQQEKMKIRRQERSRLLPIEARRVQVHDLITIDQSEPVTLAHLRDHCYRVTNVRGKVISYVPADSDRPQRSHQVAIDRVRVIPDNVTWSDIRPRPRRNRKGPDVRKTTHVPEPVPVADKSEDSDTDNSDAPLAFLPSFNNRGGPKREKSRRWLVPVRRQPARAVKRRRNSSSSMDEEPAEAKLRVASLHRYC